MRLLKIKEKRQNPEGPSSCEEVLSTTTTVIKNDNVLPLFILDPLLNWNFVFNPVSD